MTGSSADRWEVPEPAATLDVRTADGAVITLRRHGNPGGPRLILSHGNALAIDLYYPFWSLLTAEFDVVVHDLRNHGWNSVGALRDHTVPTFARDHDAILEAVGAHFGRRPTVGVFHSASGLASLLSPARGSEYAALVLFDPPLCKPGRSHAEFEAAAERLGAIARRRAPRFATRQDFADLVQFLPPFRKVVPGVADLLARTTLRPAADGESYELRCPREYEAQIVEHANVFAVLVDFDEIACPVKVIGADPTLPYSYLPTLDLSDMLSVDYDFVPDTTHLLQVEMPEKCVAAMLDFLERVLTG